MLKTIWRLCADTTLIAVLLIAWMLGWFHLLGRPGATWWSVAIIFAPVWVAAILAIAGILAEIIDLWRARR